LSFADDVKSYFGETVAIYFAYFGFYTWYLIPPALFGILCHHFRKKYREEYAVIALCIFNLMWLTFFLEMWKRQTAELAYRWGTINFEPFEEPRPEYYGTPGRDPVTGRMQPQYSGTLRLFKLYFVSGPVMIVMLFIVFATMLQFFEFEDYFQSTIIDDSSLYSQVMMQLPSSCYVTVIMVFTAIYRWIAVKLTTWGTYAYHYNKNYTATGTRALQSKLAYS
jgi:anoctamin-10